VGNREKVKDGGERRVKEELGRVKDLDFLVSAVGKRRCSAAVVVVVVAVAAAACGALQTFFFFPGFVFCVLQPSFMSDDADDADDDDGFLFFLFFAECVSGICCVDLMNFLCCVIIITKSIVCLSVCLSLSKLLELLLELLFFARFIYLFI